MHHTLFLKIAQVTEAVSPDITINERPTGIILRPTKKHKVCFIKIENRKKKLYVAPSDYPPVFTNGDLVAFTEICKHAGSKPQAIDVVVLKTARQLHEESKRKTKPANLVQDHVQQSIEPATFSSSSPQFTPPLSSKPLNNQKDLPSVPPFALSNINEQKAKHIKLLQDDLQLLNDSREQLASYAQQEVQLKLALELLTRNREIAERNHQFLTNRVQEHKQIVLTLEQAFSRNNYSLEQEKKEVQHVPESKTSVTPVPVSIPQEEPILIVNVETSQGKIPLSIYQNSEPRTVAKNFCEQQCIEEEGVLEALTELILNTIKQYS